MLDNRRKAQRINRVRNSFESEEDILHWLPEIEHIYDDDLRSCTLRTFLDGCPDYFITKPSSSTGKYHSFDEIGKYGNLIHTKRVFAEYCSISESYVEADKMTEWEREAGKSAALMHDMAKYGWPSEDREHTTSEHDVIAANIAFHIGGVPDEVHSLIHSHMGPWGEGMLPQNERQWLLHVADKSASGKREDDLAVHFAPDEVLEEWPNITQIEHDGGEKI